VGVAVFVGVGVAVGARMRVSSPSVLFVSSSSAIRSSGSTTTSFTTTVSTETMTLPVIVIVRKAPGPVASAPISQSTVPPRGDPSCVQVTPEGAVTLPKAKAAGSGSTTRASTTPTLPRLRTSIV
jgi:hypothetical protein